MFSQWLSNFGMRNLHAVFIQPGVIWQLLGARTECCFATGCGLSNWVTNIPHGCKYNTIVLQKNTNGLLTYHLSSRLKRNTTWLQKNNTHRNYNKGTEKTVWETTPPRPPPHFTIVCQFLFLFFVSPLFCGSCKLFCIPEAFWVSEQPAVAKASQ